MAQETNQLTNQKMSWAEVVKVAHLVVSDQKSQSPLEERIIGDLEDMGSGKNEISPELVVNGSSETFCPNLVDESGDRALSKLERKKRDRAKRRFKQAWNSFPPVEVEGRSLSDSDLQIRRDILIREAKMTLQVGKTISIQFRGDENEAVEELTNIAEKEQHLF
ncbi:hypothetical protein V6N13_113712 [Hibiscus sabdariffa]